MTQPLCSAQCLAAPPRSPAFPRPALGEQAGGPAPSFRGQVQGPDPMPAAPWALRCNGIGQRVAPGLGVGRFRDLPAQPPAPGRGRRDSRGSPRLLPARLGGAQCEAPRSPDCGAASRLLGSPPKSGTPPRRQRGCPSGCAVLPGTELRGASRPGSPLRPRR